MCAATVGTETDGSIVCPAGNTWWSASSRRLGLLSQDWDHPDHPQPGHRRSDGPYRHRRRGSARRAADRRSGRCWGTRCRGTTRGFSTRTPGWKDHRRRPALLHRRTSTASRKSMPFSTRVSTHSKLWERRWSRDTGDVFAFGGDEFTVLLMEFKVHIAEYLAGLSHTPMRTLADLIAFNIATARSRCPYYGQELFELSESTSGDLSDPAYLAARANCLQMSRTLGHRPGALDRNRRHRRTSYSSPPAAAVAGYPNLALPVGITPAGKPAGMLMYAGFLEEPTLMAFAYDLEQALQPRTARAVCRRTAGIPAQPWRLHCNPEGAERLQGEGIPHRHGKGRWTPALITCRRCRASRCCRVRTAS